MSWIDDLVKSVSHTEETVDSSVWKPFPESALAPYYWNHLAKKILQAVKICKEKNIKPETIAETWKSQSWLRDQLATFVAYLDIIKLQKSEKILIIDFFHETLLLSKTDPFSLKGITHIYDTETVNGILSNLKWLESDKHAAREVGFLSTSLLTLGYALYTDLFPSVGVDFHGPYRLNKDSHLIVRDFFDTKPEELWAESKEFRYKSLTIFTIYKKARFFIDFYGNLTCDENLTLILKRFAVVVDGKNIDSLREISNLGNYFSKLTVEIYKKFTNLNFEQTKRKFMEAHFYGYKSLCDLAGIDWEPPQKAYYAIEGKHLLQSDDEDWIEKMRKDLRNLYS